MSIFRFFGFGSTGANGAGQDKLRQAIAKDLAALRAQPELTAGPELGSLASLDDHQPAFGRRWGAGAYTDGTPRGR